MENSQIYLFNELESHSMAQNVDGVFIVWQNMRFVVEDSCFKYRSYQEWEIIRNKILSFLNDKKLNPDNCVWTFLFYPQDELLLIGNNQINVARL